MYTRALTQGLYVRLPHRSEAPQTDVVRGAADFSCISVFKFLFLNSVLIVQPCKRHTLTLPPPPHPTPRPSSSIPRGIAKCVGKDKVGVVDGDTCSEAAVLGAATGPKSKEEANGDAAADRAGGRGRGELGAGKRRGSDCRGGERVRLERETPVHVECTPLVHRYELFCFLSFGSCPVFEMSHSFLLFCSLFK